MDWLLEFILTIQKRNIRRIQKNKKYPKSKDFSKQTEQKIMEKRIKWKPGYPPKNNNTHQYDIIHKIMLKTKLTNLSFPGLEKVENAEAGFVTPSVKTVKRDKSIKKLTLNSGKINDSCKKMRSLMPNMGELLNQISIEITKVQNEPKRISKKGRVRIWPNEIVRKNKQTM